jgi:hypothetical protein
MFATLDKLPLLHIEFVGIYNLLPYKILHAYFQQFIN